MLPKADAKECRFEANDQAKYGLFNRAAARAKREAACDRKCAGRSPALMGLVM
jgi:hypothetical protein